MTTMFRIPTEVYEQVRAHCARRGVPLSEWAVAAFREAMAQDDRRKKLVVLSTAPLFPDPFTRAPFWELEPGRTH